MAKRIIPLLLCVMLIMSSVGVSAQPEDVSAQATTEFVKSVDVKEGYVLVEDTDALALYADMKTGDFAVLDKTVNRIWYSGQNEVLDAENPISQLNFGRVKTDLVSMLAISYVQVSTIASTAVPLYQNSYAYCVNDGNVSVKTVSGGYRAEYCFEDLETLIPVDIILKDNSITVSIVGSEIKTSDAYRITSIALLPGFLAGDDRNDGYLFVPSGSGALVPFATGRGEIAVYSEMVYGDDVAIEQEEYEGEDQKISVPVYGIKSGNSAITAIITSGDSSARITAEADSLSSSFTRVYSEYITSIIDSTTLFESNYENQRIIYGAESRKSYLDYSVEFVFLNGESADYSGMAEVYREHLDLKSKAAAPSLKLTVYGAAEKKASFLGIPYKKTIALTTFEQAEKIVTELNKNDAPVALQYVGWNNSGIDNKKVASRFSPAGVLGGKSGFKKLYKFIESTDATAWFDVDLMLIQKSGNGFSAYSDVCKSIFNTRTPIYDYMRSVYVPVNNRDPHYLLTPANVKSAADKFLKRYSYGGGLSFADLGNAVYSDFKNGEERIHSIEYFTLVLKKAAEDNDIALNTPNAYAFEYADIIYNLPMSNDGNLLFSQSVPFLQMILHGSVSYGATPDCDLLDCIEYGADPAVYGIYADASTLIETDYNWLYGSTYSNWKADAIELFGEYSRVYKELYSSVITEHSSLDGLSRTEFDNGTVIYVNRTEKEVGIEDVTVPAGGYKVIGGEG